MVNQALSVYPRAVSIALFEQLVSQPATRYWGEWYAERLESARFMRTLALSYAE